MIGRRSWLGGVLLALAFFGLETRADAVITAPRHLSDFIADANFIFTATVDSVDAENLRMVLTFDENLKGKVPFERLPITLKGDADSDKLKHRPLLLKRVAPKLPVVVFVTLIEKDYIAFVYTNGTWFQLTAEKPDGNRPPAWSYTHIEPNLRATYKGTTAEMKQTLVDAISGKKKPPAMNAKEAPGVGPEVEPEKPKEEKKSAAPAVATGPVFGVIPAVMVGGPLALLAMLFPSVFGGWRRWLSLISVTCTTSTIYWLHWWLSSSHPSAWWSSTFAYWMFMTLATVAGAFWAWQRHIHRLMFGEAPLRPGLLEQIIMVAVSFFALGTVAYYIHFQGANTLLRPDGLPVLAFTAGVWAGTAFALVVGNRPARLPALGTEVVVLTTMALVSVGLLFAVAGGSRAQTALVEGDTDKTAKLVWTFDLPDKGAVASSPVVVGERVYIAAAHDNAFRPYGALYCLDRATGKPVWAFNNGKKMKQVFSTPAVVGDRVYIGEGFHQDSFCKIFCLKADSGEKMWDFETGSHTESNPFVADGKVYCGAGDDGLYCLDAKTGEKVWQFSGFHVDAGPIVVGDKLYCGAGVGDVFKETIFFCLDAKTGDVRWKVAAAYPVWSSAAVEGDRVYFGMGNGRLNESDPNPAGAMVCVDATKGEEVWRQKLPDAVLSRPTLFAGHLYFGCRDGAFYCLNAKTGKPRWKAKTPSPVVANAPVVQEADGGPAWGVYAVCSEGQLICLSADTGQTRWAVDLARGTEANLELFSSPWVQETAGKEPPHAEHPAAPWLTRAPEPDGKEPRLRMYFGVTLVTTSRKGALVCYEEVAKKEKE